MPLGTNEMNSVDTSWMNAAGNSEINALNADKVNFFHFFGSFPIHLAYLTWFSYWIEYPWIYFYCSWRQDSSTTLVFFTYFPGLVPYDIAVLSTMVSDNIAKLAKML